MNKLKMALMAALALPSLSAVAEEEKSAHSIDYNLGVLFTIYFQGPSHKLMVNLPCKVV